MKKILPLLLMAFATQMVSAQQLSNTTFNDEWVNCYPWESGATVSSPRSTQPEGWCISNVSNTALPVVGEEVTPGADGTGKAVKLTNVKASIGDNTAPAYITLGTAWATAETKMTSVRNADGGVFGGVSFSFHPDAVRLTYKHDISAGDENMSVVAYLWKGTWTQASVPSNTAVGILGWGNATKVDMTDRIHNILGKNYLTGGDVTKTDDAELIASVEYYDNTAVSNWTTQEFPLEYKSDATPEKVNIVIASNGLFDDRSTIKSGNSVTVDDVELVYWHTLSALTYGGETLNFSEDITDYELSSAYDEAKLSYTVKGRAATATTFFDEETGMLTIRVEGEDIEANPESFTEYRIQFGAGGQPKLDVDWNWNAATRYFLNTTVENAFVLTSGDTSLFSFSSSNEDVAKLENGKLIVGGQAGAAIITVSCAGSSRWNAREEQYEVQAVAAGHVPFDLTQDLYDAVKGETSGTQAWDANGGIRLGNNSEIFSWGNRFYVMKITGLPDKLSFKYGSSNGASSRQYAIYESADGENFTEIWRDNRGSGLDNNLYSSGDIQLRPDTRFVKFFYYGNCAAYYREVKVTELVKFESDTDEIVMNETESTAGFTFTHANARTGFITVTTPQGITVDVPEFVGGLDIYAEQPLTVSYDPYECDVEDDIIISDGVQEKKVHIVARVEDPTEIKDLKVLKDSKDLKVYNLAGQRIQKMQKGINIVDGRKVLR